MARVTRTITNDEDRPWCLAAIYSAGQRKHKTFSAEDLAHRTIKAVIWGMPAVRLVGKGSWPPLFYLRERGNIS